MPRKRSVSKRKLTSSNTVFWLGALIILLLAAVLYAFYTMQLQRRIPAEVKQYAKDWPLANRDYANTRATTDSSITKESVKNLKADWSTPITGISEWGAAATNPIILGDKVYFQDLKSNVYAVDFVTGKVLWTKEYNLNNIGPNGVAVAGGKIFAIKGPYEVVALDLEGNELWSKKLSDNENVGIDVQVTPYADKVYVCTVPGVSNQNFYKGGGIGRVVALQAETGDVAWSFDTVDSEDIWGNKEVNSGGGCWYPPAIDVKTGKSYWAFANPAPWPGTKEFPNGTSRPGDNLYTNSLVELNPLTGRMKWYNQVLPHDLFDYDFMLSPILTTAKVNNRMQNIIIGGGKMGKVYAFNRSSGQTLWETAVGTHKNDTLKELPKGITEVSPGPLGGVETPMAYADGVVYAPVVNMTVKYTPEALDAGSVNISAGTGELNALDVQTGKILWTKKFDSINVGGATVVNDLVFTATFNGKIYALDKATGDIVWEYQASGGINGWPAVKGDTIIIPVGFGQKPYLLALKIQ